MLGKILRRAFRRNPRADGAAALAVSEALGLEATGRAAEARERLRNALQSGIAADAALLCVLGRLEAQAGDPARALEALERACTVDPESADARADLANVYALRGDREAAARACRAALELDGAHPRAHNHLGLLLAQAGDRVGAVGHFRAAVAAAPRFQAAIRNLVAWLPDNEVPDAALALLQGIVEREPGHADAHAALGALYLKGEFNARPALAALERALALGVDDPDTHAARGVALHDLGRAHDALAAYERALALDPEHVPARFHRALTLLALGRYDEGWPGYELRLRSEDRPRRDFPFPRWAGEPLADRTVLVHAEQGVGDEILFASCLPEVIAQAGRCIIDCDPRLASLYRRSFPRADVRGGTQLDPIGWASALAADFQVPIASLPLYLRRRAEEFPARAGYSTADTARVAVWRERLARAAAGPWLGVSWRGGTPRSRGRARSIDLSELAGSLRTPGVNWVSLQRGAADEELAAMERVYGVRIFGWPDALEDLDETAALLGALDVVVSIDNTVAQLAGATGRRCWVLLAAAAEWRYGAAGERVAWYPGMRLARQSTDGDWSAPLAAVAAALQELVGTSAA